MQKKVNYQKKVYIIMLFILLLAGITQLARSEFILKFKHNEKTHQKYEAIKEESMEESSNVLAAISEDRGEYCLAYDGAEELSVEIKENTEQVLQYMKQPYHPIDLDNISLDPEKCSAILLTASLDSVDYEIPAIIDYVESGGYVFWMRSDNPNQSFHKIHRKLGFVNFEYLQGKYGIELTSNVLINQAGTKFGGDFIYNDVMPAELDSDTELLATTADQNPLMWRKELGNGAFIVFNGNSLDGKDTRGLIAGGISLLEPDYIYPVFNAKLFYIDDFPAPVPQGINEQIYSDYQMDIPTFFHEIWWPHMLKAANVHDVKYTAVAIQTYNDIVKPPFDKAVDEELHNLIRYGREVIKSGGEIGVHGYNHQSLQMDKKIAGNFGYNAWETEEDMKDAIRTVLRYLEKAFPSYNLMSYVPPSNVLGIEGRAALSESWSDLAVVSSLYMTDRFGDSYIQEFEMASDGVLEMPRITSGYFDTEYHKWLEANTVTSLAFFSHFLHPDDLLDEERGRQQDWESLYQDFEHMLDRLQKTYPWLRSMTSADAAISIAEQLKSGMTVGKTPKDMKVTAGTEKTEKFFMLRTKKKIGKLRNCSVEQIDDNVYLVKTADSDFSIGLGG